jgi:hypothetical protein
MITRKDFEEAYKKFPPQGHELFFLKYISIHSLYENRWFIFVISLILLIPFLSEVFFYLFSFCRIYKIAPNLIYILILAFLGFYLYIIWYKKHKRFKKIRKYLGVSKKEFQNLVKMYFYHRYPNTKKYIEYNSR